MIDRRSTRAAIAAGVTLTAFSVLAPLAGAGTVLYLGGTCACNSTSAGADTIANGYLATRGTTQAVPYAAGLNFPVTIPVGAQRLLASSYNAEGPVVWSGVSQGALIVHEAEREIMARPESQRPDKDQLSFVVIADEADPFNGIITKNPILRVLVPVSDVESPYDTVSIAREYDGFADWPDRPNPVAVANAVMGIVYLHPDYEDVDITAPGTVVQERTNSLGGKTTRYTVPTKDLPLTRPLRDVEKAVTGQTALTDGVDAVVRPVVDAGYERNDDKPTSARNIRKSTTKALRNDVKAAKKHVRTEGKKLAKKIRDSINRKDNDNA